MFTCANIVIASYVSSRYFDSFTDKLLTPLVLLIFLSEDHPRSGTISIFSFPFSFRWVMRMVQWARCWTYEHKICDFESWSRCHFLSFVSHCSSLLTLHNWVTLWQISVQTRWGVYRIVRRSIIGLVYLIQQFTWTLYPTSASNAPRREMIWDNLCWLLCATLVSRAFTNSLGNTHLATSTH